MGCGGSTDTTTVVYRCLRCGGSTDNGPPNQYCSVECKDGTGGGGTTPKRASGGSAPPATCSRPGCGRPTFDGNPGFCSKTCRSNSTSGPAGALCSRPGCGKPTWDGKPGGFCGKFCRDKGGDSAGAAGAVCIAPGCGKPSWNGAPNDYCGQACRDAAAAAAKPAGPVCLSPNCGKPTWNGLPNEYCSNFCKGSSRTASAKLLNPGEKKYEDVKKQYDGKWDSSRGAVAPIRAIYEIAPSSDQFLAFDKKCKDIGNVATFGNGTNPGNVQRRFHGTRIKCQFNGTVCSDSECCACRIISDGFDMGKLGSWSGNKGHYGGGLYFTSMSSTAKGYGTNVKGGYTFAKGNWADPAAGNAILVVKVACGKVETVTDKTDSAIDRSQFDSRKIDKDTGVDELVVFEANQSTARYMIVF